MGVYSNYVVTESGIYSPSAMNAGGSALDLMIECAQDDMKMFDSVIELDFMHAYSEAGMVSITEADDEKAEKSIGQKIKELFEKIKKKIKDFISTFIAKLQNLFHNDISLYKEYEKDFANAAGVKINGYRKLKSLGAVSGKYKNQGEQILKELQDISDKIDSAGDSNAVSKILDDMNEEKTLKKTKESLKTDEVFFDSDKNQDEYTLTTQDVNIIMRVMKSGGKEIVNLCRDMGKWFDKSIEDQKRHIKYEKYMTGYNTNDKEADLAIEKLNAKYKLCNKFGSIMSKFSSSICNMCARYVAMARKAFVAGAKKAQSKSSAKGESAISNDTYAYILGEASDIYVESVLNMV